MEEFVYIPGYGAAFKINKEQQVVRMAHSFVGSDGRKINKKDRICTPTINSYGYVTVRLIKDGKPKNVLLHRLMGLTFIPNPENKRTINHINGIKTDNRLENLEWATDSENGKHANRIGLRNAKRGEDNPMYNRRGKDSPHFGKTRGLNYGAKLILDTQSGIFYDCAADAADAKGFKLPVLRHRLNGSLKNKTGLMYV